MPIRSLNAYKTLSDDETWEFTCFGFAGLPLENTWLVKGLRISSQVCYCIIQCLSIPIMF